jgi:hypothetical protein
VLWIGFGFHADLDPAFFFSMQIRIQGAKSIWIQCGSGSTGHNGS